MNLRRWRLGDDGRRGWGRRRRREKDRRRHPVRGGTMAHAQLSRINQQVEKLMLRRTTPSEPPPHHLKFLQEDLEALQRMVRRVQAVLADAEEMEIHQESVRLWLRELKGVAYDAEDVLDEYEYELLRAEMEAAGVDQRSEPAVHLPNPQQKRKRGRSTKMWRRRSKKKTADRPSTSHAVEVSKLSNSSSSSDVSYWDKTADRIGKIRGRFEEISWQRDALHLREGDGERRFLSTTEGRPPSGHLVDAPTLFGRKDDLEKVIDQLLCSDEHCKNSSNPLSVLPIVGMGGVGKTTLVQHVYNDRRVLEHFPLRGWVCVSDDFSVQRLTARIIESLSREVCRLNEFSTLQEKLVNTVLDGKRFLLVLDDVWNRNPRLWESLQRPLMFGAQGSVVITTTRDQTVAKIMQTMPFHHLGYLSVDDCWEVFKEAAFVDRVSNDHGELLKVGYQIVRKCRGLPLAAKSMGSLLSYENDVAKWEQVLHSDIWDLGGEGADEIFPALRLSYLYLPTHLKPCFLYTTLFPKDFRFLKEELILLWMAQGFLQCKGNKHVEDVGSTYFDELVQRSFLQYFGETFMKEPYFVMHDLIHDLAQHTSHGEFFHMQGEQENVLCYPNKEVRHLSIRGERVRDLADILCSLSHYTPQSPIRTLMVRRKIWEHLEYLKFPSEVMPHLEFLRALDLRSSSISELPDSVGNLKLLRYLNLSNSEIEKLPDSICKLCNLQTLCVQSCHRLKSLPKDIGILGSLRCLKIDASTYFLPRGIGKLINLRTLNQFMVGRGWWLIFYAYLQMDSLLQIFNAECSGIEELKDLIHLRGSLRISELSNVKNAEDAKIADLRNKRGIRKLVLRWSRTSSDEDKYYQEHAPLDVQMQVMEYLRPPDLLQDLRIDNYGAPNFPRWMGDDLLLFSQLIRIQLICCQCTSLPPLGQLPYLKYLEIEGLDMVEAIGPEFCGHGPVGFPALEELQFLDMVRWVTWELTAERGDVFPCLRYLSVCSCPTLESMAPLYLLPVLEMLAIGLCRKIKSIELIQSSSPSSCSSASSLSSSSMGPPPLKSMSIKNCPLARFLPDDGNNRLSLLPATLHTLDIDWDSPLLVEWCARGGGSRLTHIPNAKVWNVGNGQKFVATWNNVPTSLAK